MNTTFPPAPFSSGVTPAMQALAFSETRSRFPRKGVTVVHPCGIPDVDSLSLWGPTRGLPSGRGPAETA